MRVLFEHDLSGKEREALRAMDRRIDAFWDAASKLPFGKLADLVQGIDRRLVLARWTDHWGLSTDDPAARPLLDRVVRAAPRSAQPVHTWRPELKLAEAVARAREYCDLELSEARVRVGFSRGHLVHVTVFVPGLVSQCDEPAIDAVDELVEGMLGQRVYERWVGAVIAEPAPKRRSLPVLSGDQGHAGALELSELPAVLRAAREGLYESLPRAGLSEDQADEGWTLLEAEPVVTRNFKEKDDLMMAATRLPELIKCFLEGAPFASERFSRNGESFCYVKVDQLEVDDSARLEQRRKLEEALDESLRSSGLGCVFGTGFGVRHAYVDLALSDLDAGAQRVAHTVKDLGVSRAWLQFFDTELAEQWLGLGDSRGLPPGFEPQER